MVSVRRGAFGLLTGNANVVVRVLPARLLRYLLILQD